MKKKKFLCSYNQYSVTMAFLKDMDNWGNISSRAALETVQSNKSGILPFHR